MLSVVLMIVSVGFIVNRNNQNTIRKAITMKLENAEKVVKELQKQGDKIAHVRRGYSGRGMFGQTTTGIICSSIVDCIKVMGRLDIDDSTRSDNMGRDHIVY